MGLFDKRRPPEQQTPPHSTWEADRARVASFLYRARTFTGTGPEDPTLTIQLRPGEHALLVATGTFLVEPKRVQAHWAGAPGAAGEISFHVARRPVAATGQDPASDGVLTPIDRGDITFTDQRIVFAGTQGPREWDYASLLGFNHVDHPPWTLVAVSGRDQASGFRYDQGQADEVRFAMVLGLARFRNAVDALVADLQAQLNEMDQAHAAAAAGQALPQQWQGQPAAQAPMGAQPMPAGMQQPGAQFGQPAAPLGAGPSIATAAAAPATNWPAAAPFAATPQPAAGSPAPPVTPAAAPPVEAPAPVEAPPAPAAAESAPVPEPPAPAAASAEATPAQAPPMDTGVPTGEIPAVNPTPTEPYPAVRQEPAAAQPYQAAQPAQAASNTPPGWYPDPWRVARVRWWDGYTWTSYTSH